MKFLNKVALALVLPFFVSTANSTELLIPATPGGNYDLVGRVVAKHLPKYLKDTSTIRVENIPGAFSYHAARKLLQDVDGSTIALLDRQFSFSAINNPDILKEFNPLLDFYSIASFRNYNMVCLSLKNIKDYNYIGTTVSNQTYLKYIIESGILNGKAVIYPNANEVNLALERNEVNIRCADYEGMINLKPEWATSANIVLQLKDNNYITDEQKIILNTIIGPYNIDKPFYINNKASNEKKSEYRKAFTLLSEDNDFIKDLERIKSGTEFTDGSTLDKIIENYFKNLTPQVLSILNKLSDK